MYKAAHKRNSNAIEFRKDFDPEVNEDNDETQVNPNTESDGQVKRQMIIQN